MPKYPFISEAATTYAEWEGKSISHKYQYEADFLYPKSYVYDTTNTKIETYRQRNLTLGYKYTI